MCIISSTRNNRRLPKIPPGCDKAKSFSLNPRVSNNAIDIASPIANVAVVLEVGAKPSGHASFSTLTSILTVDDLANVES